MMLNRSLRAVGTLVLFSALSMSFGLTRASASGSGNGTFTSTVQFCNYSVTVPAGDIDVSETMPLGPTDDNDPLVVLRNADGSYIERDDDSGDGYNSNLVYTVEAGTYIIEATTNDYYFDQTIPQYDPEYLGSFTLTVNSSFSSFSLISCGPGGNPGGVTWFNPGDSRIDGQPGDRVVVWCNKSPDEIVVYGVGDSSNKSHGFLLGVFSNADLLAASGKGITKNAGLGNGTISAMQDGKGNFYVAWNGGNFNATGVGIFSKTFSCFQ